MEATEAIASVAPGLCLGALSKVPIEIYKFLRGALFQGKIALPLQVQSIRPAMPLQSMPLQSMSLQSMPLQSMPLQSMPLQSMPYSHP